MEDDALGRSGMTEEEWKLAQGHRAESVLNRARARGWTLKFSPAPDPLDPGRLTCPACDQVWHVLPNADGDFPDYSFLCPHGCNRKDLTNGEDRT